MTALSLVTRFKARLSRKLARPKLRASLHSKPRSVEVLERRQLLSTFSVKNLHDSGPGLIHPAIIETSKPAIDATSHNHLIGHSDAATRVRYYNADRCACLFQPGRAFVAPTRVGNI